MPLPPQLRLNPVSPADAVVRIPGSKSITNRAYVIAALAYGDSTLRGPLYSDDTEAMSQCLNSLGVTIDAADPNIAKVNGSGGKFTAPIAPLFVKNSGTTIRFLTAVAALTPRGSNVILDGIARMRQRPIGDLIEALQQIGVLATTAENGCPPVSVVGGGIKGGRCSIKGSLSSQFLSALLMASPYAGEDVQIIVDGELVSKPYVDMTLSIMSEFGVNVQQENYSTFFVSSSQKYIGRDYNIEPDASNASYFLAAAAVTGGSVKVEGLGTNSIQGDVAFVDVLEKMGCIIDRRADSFSVTGPQKLAPIDFDATRIPDMAQTIAAIAYFASGPSRLTGLKTLRVKETDRISAMATELRRIGADVIEGTDYLVISPPNLFVPAKIDTYDDHRMAMSFAVIGLKLKGLIINDPACVGKTFPDFWDRWAIAFPGSIIDKVDL